MISPLTPRSAGHPRPVAAASVAGPEREAARSSGAAGSIRGPLRMQKVATGRNRKAEMTGSRAAAVGADICSPHPDAVRRRREAEARQLRRLQELRELTKETASGEIGELPNVTIVQDVEGYEKEVRAARVTGKQVIIHFKSASCQSCLRLSYRLKTVAEKLPGADFIVVDLGNGEGLLTEKCKEIGIHKVPYFQLYTNGVIVSKGGWKDIPLLSIYEYPEDMRTCSVGGFRSLKKNDFIPDNQGNSSEAKGNMQPLTTAQNGLDILRQAKLI